MTDDEMIEAMADVMEEQDIKHGNDTAYRGYYETQAKAILEWLKPRIAADATRLSLTTTPWYNVAKEVGERLDTAEKEIRNLELKVQQARLVLAEILELWFMWREGVFRKIGISWKTEDDWPPAFRRAKAFLRDAPNPASQTDGRPTNLDAFRVD